MITFYATQIMIVCRRVAVPSYINSISSVSYVSYYAKGQVTNGIRMTELFLSSFVFYVSNRPEIVIKG